MIGYPTATSERQLDTTMQKHVSVYDCKRSLYGKGSHCAHYNGNREEKDDVTAAKIT